MKKDFDRRDKKQNFKNHLIYKHNVNDTIN